MTKPVNYPAQSRDSSIQWNPQGPRSEATILTTTFAELMEAAHHYKLWDLAQHCEDKVVAGLSESTIRDVLLDLAPEYPTIKERAMEYVMQNRAALLRGGRDMFAEHKDHLNCHKVMLEIMQLMMQKMST